MALHFMRFSETFDDGFRAIARSSLSPNLSLNVTCFIVKMGVLFLP